MLMNDISRIEKKRRGTKKEIYVKIYEQLSRKIRQSVELRQKHVFLQIPAFLFGFPTYDRGKATDYMKRQFELEKFNVVRVSEFELFVSWVKTHTNAQVKNPEPKEEDALPSLANLRKAANKYRGAK
jgi:hypothetical protein